MPASADELFLLSLDLGTSTIKAGVFDRHGREVTIASEEYLVIPEGDTTVELPAEVFWEVSCRVIHRALAQAPAVARHIAGVSISSHAETLVFLDSFGRPVRPAMFTSDARAEEEAYELAEYLGSEWVLQQTGQPDVVAQWPACKIAWLRKHEPTAFSMVAYYLMAEDYVLYRLTGELCGEVTCWLSSIMVDIHRNDWLEPVLSLIGVQPSQLPRLLPCGTLIGHVTAAASGQTGLPAGIPVAMGAMDQLCAALAAGNITPGSVTASTGSVIALVASTDRLIFDPVSKISCYPHAIAGVYCLLPWNPTGGLVLKWFKDRFCEAEQTEADRLGISVYDLLTRDAASVPPGCAGLVMLPHLQGMLYPEVNPTMRGAFCGFSLAHTRAHFTRAILEAIAFMLRNAVEILAGLGVQVNEVRHLGGGSRSYLWNSIMANVCQKPVVIATASEAALLGAAILAAPVAGIYPDTRTAVTAMAHLGDRFEPDPAMAAPYSSFYARYQALCRQLRPWFA
ncbi:MAG: xylulokinase [Anaerolineae bacterium]